MIANYEFRNENGQLHKTDGPAIEYDGDKYWYQNGKLHREDGPAVITAANSKHWLINGKRHRLDGPAIERYNGINEYWINGKQLTEDEFNLYTFVNKL